MRIGPSPFFKQPRRLVQVKKVDSWPDLYEICGCYGNVKNDGHTIDIVKFFPEDEWTATEISDTWSKSSFQNYEKILWGAGENGMTSTPSLPRLGVRGLKTIISLSENK